MFRPIDITRQIIKERKQISSTKLRGGGCQGKGTLTVSAMVVILFFGVIHFYALFTCMFYIVKNKMKASLDSGMREA